MRRLESASLETSGGESAGPLLARLRGDLEVHRADIATGAALDREWAGRVVRWVAGWLPDQELPLIASLGGSCDSEPEDSVFVAAAGAILDRDLRTLRRELEAYPDETRLWQTVPGMANTAGTLALHLVGNLRFFVGGTLGDTGYVRNRPAEFSRRDVPRRDLIEEIETCARGAGPNVRGARTTARSPPNIPR